MNEREAREIRGVLSRRFPGGEVTVTAERDGARIVVAVNGESHKFSVGDGPSVLLNYLLAGFGALSECLINGPMSPVVAGRCQVGAVAGGLRWAGADPVFLDV